MKKILSVLLCLFAFCHSASAFDFSMSERMSIEQSELGLLREIHESANTNQGTGSRSYVYPALCKLYFGTDTARANELLVDEHITECKTRSDFERAPFQLYWSMPAYIKVYYMFNSSDGTRYNGALNPETEQKMLEVMWAFTEVYGSELFSDDNNRVFNSENHDMLCKSAVYLAAQALSKTEEYGSRVLDGGKTLNEFVSQAEDFFDLYFTNRAKTGLYIEGSESYRTITLEGIYNLMDFSGSETVRKKAKMFADITWIEYAVESLNGIRGGAKSRVYNRPGDADVGYQWFSMLGSLYFDLNGEKNPSVIASILVNNYRPPEIAREIARQVDKGNYEFIRQIPGYGSYSVLSIDGFDIPIYDIKDDKGVITYTYATPDYVAGTMYQENAKGLSLLSSQNRWQGAIFKVENNARIYPCTDVSTTTHNNFDSVQKGPVMFFKKNADIGGETVIYISPGAFKTTNGEIQLNNGWLFGRMGNAYFGVKPLSGTIMQKEGKVILTEGYSPFVIHVGSEAEDGKFETFTNRVVNNQYYAKGNMVCYRDYKWGEVSLSISGETEHFINGKSVEYNPVFIMKSPYINSAKNSGVFEITFEGKRIFYDFNEGTVRSVPYIRKDLKNENNKH